MFKYIVFGVLNITLVLSAPTLKDAKMTNVTFRDCGGKSKVGSVLLSTTCGQDGCLLKRGTTVSMEVDFISGEDTKSLKSVCHGIIGGVRVPFPLGKSDGCDGCGVTCPVTKGTKESFKTAIAVKKSYPKLKLVVQWEEQGDDRKDLFCIAFPAEIVD